MFQKIKVILILSAFIIIYGCTSNKFIFTSNSYNYLTKKESKIIKECLKNNKSFLKINGLKVSKNKKDNRFYLGVKNDNILTMFEVNCENINMFFNDTIQSSNFDKIFIYTNKASGKIEKISNGFNQIASSPGVFAPRCEFYKNGKLKSCFNGQVMYDIDSITRKIKKTTLGF